MGKGRDQEETRVGGEWGEEIKELTEGLGWIVVVGYGEAQVGTPADVENYAPGEKYMHNFWRCGTACIVDIWVTDSDATKYCRNPALAVLAQQDQKNKTKYLERCLKMRRDFNALVYLVDGMIGEDVRVSEKCVA